MCPRKLHALLRLERRLHSLRAIDKEKLICPRCTFLGHRNDLSSVQVNALHSAVFIYLWFRRLVATVHICFPLIAKLPVALVIRLNENFLNGNLALDSLGDYFEPSSSTLIPMIPNERVNFASRFLPL